MRWKVRIVLMYLCGCFPPSLLGRQVSPERLSPGSRREQWEEHPTPLALGGLCGDQLGTETLGLGIRNPQRWFPVSIMMGNWSACRALKRCAVTSLVIQGLRIHLAMQGPWVWFLVGELGSHMLRRTPQLESLWATTEDLTWCNQDPVQPDK